MDKNLLAAFGLSTLVIVVYFLLFPPPPSKKEEPIVRSETSNSAPAKNLGTSTDQTVTPSLSPDSTPKQESVPEKDVVVETPLYKATLSSNGAYFKSFYLNRYNYNYKPKIPIYKKAINWILGNKAEKIAYDPDRRVNMVGDLDPLKSKPSEFFPSPEFQNLRFSTEAEQVEIQNKPSDMKFEAFTPNGLKVVKTFQFSPDSYIVNIDVQVTNTSESAQNLEPIFRLGAGNEMIEHQYRSHSKEGMALVDTSFEKFDSDDVDEEIQNFDWAGTMSTYFLTAVKPPSKEKWKGKFSPIPSQLDDKQVTVLNLDLKGEKEILQPGQTWNREFEIFMGPKKKEEMDKFSDTLQESLDLVINFLARPMLFGLRWYHNFTGNWGIAIILLTITVRILIFPLALKGMKSMKRMQKLAPKMKELKEKHGENKERLNKEIMSLYKRNSINPVGGCLPLVMQIPIFIALYWALLPAIELRHQPFFFWIEDLSAMDYTLILPLLMGVTMFFQQKVTPMSATMDPMQQKIFKFFPLVMVFFFLSFPSGLVLYWVTSNSITIGQQAIFNRVHIKGIVD